MAPSIVATGPTGQVSTGIAGLVDRIRGHIERGVKAAEKADEHFKAAGLLIKLLKDQRPHDWKMLVQERCGIARSRAYELLKIADGRATAEKIREQTNERSRRHDAKVKSSVANGQNNPSLPAAVPDVETEEDAPAVAQPDDRHDRGDVDGDHGHDRGDVHVQAINPAIAALNVTIAALNAATPAQRAEFEHYIAGLKKPQQLAKALAALLDPMKAVTAALITKAIDFLPANLFVEGFSQAHRLQAALEEAKVATTLASGTYVKTSLIKNGAEARA